MIQYRVKQAAGLGRWLAQMMTQRGGNGHVIPQHASYIVALKSDGAPSDYRALSF
jgi:hypothetical protein